MAVKKSQKTIFVTGCAGFIGMKVSLDLLKEGTQVVGIDNLNNYYDPIMKQKRLDILKKYPHFHFFLGDIQDKALLKKIFQQYSFDGLAHIAAQAGVRYSLENPYAYLKTNEEGSLNLLELIKDFSIPKTIFASTSSVYTNENPPFSENLCANNPLSPYAASKKAMEMYAHSYHFCYDLDITILRFFTVYGPFGRPDMSILRFISWIDTQKPLQLFGDGSKIRDFTYIDDISQGVLKALDFQNTKNTFNIFNLGNSNTASMNELISIIEDSLGKKSTRNIQDSFKADAEKTFANIQQAQEKLNWTPQTPLKEGIEKTVHWYRENKNWVDDLQF